MNIEEKHWKILEDQLKSKKNKTKDQFRESMKIREKIMKINEQLGKSMKKLSHH